MNTWHTKETDALCRALLTLNTVEECYAFLDDVCTIREVTGLAMRLKVACMLKEGRNYVDISQETGASTATISRVRRCLQYGSDGYATVLQRLEAQEASDTQ